MSRRKSRKQAGTGADEDSAIAEAFKVFDQDDDGLIQADQIGTIIRALGKNPFEADVQEIIKEAGGNTALVNLEKVSAFYKRKFPKPEDQERGMRDAFVALDKDGNGTIMEAEFRQLLTTLGEPLSHKEVEAILRDLEVGPDGTILYDKFIDLIVS